MYKFEVEGHGEIKYSRRYFTREKKKVTIEAKDKSTAIIEFLTNHPEFSNKIICNLVK